MKPQYGAIDRIESCDGRMRATAAVVPLQKAIHEPEEMLLVEHLTTALVEKIMGWGIAPERFLMGNRRWIPRWRFRPIENLDDAFQLLEKAAPQEYSICGDDKGSIHVRVRIGGTAGEARGTAEPLTITCAIARAVGIEVKS